MSCWVSFVSFGRFQICPFNHIIFTGIEAWADTNFIAIKDDVPEQGIQLAPHPLLKYILLENQIALSIIDLGNYINFGSWRERYPFSINSDCECTIRTLSRSM